MELGNEDSVGPDSINTETWRYTPFITGCRSGSYSWGCGKY